MQEGQGSRTADRVAERRAAHQVRDRPLVLDAKIAQITAVEVLVRAK